MKVANKLVASLIVVTLMVVIGIGISFIAFGRIKKSADERKQTFIRIRGANELLTAIIDAETGQRGFLLTGDEALLERYNVVRKSIMGQLMDLRTRTYIGSARKHLDTLAPMITAKLAYLANNVDLCRNHDMVTALMNVRSSRGNQATNAIRAEMGRYIQIEEGALAVHDADFQSSIRRLFTLIVIASLFTLLFVLAFAILLYRETEHKLKNRIQLETQHLLEVQKESNKQLQLANVTLQVSEEKLAVTLNSIGDAVIATDAEGRVMLLNPMAEQLTGWTQSTASGRPVDEVFRIINQETRQPATIPVIETLASGTIQGLANHTVLIALDGRECAIADSCAPIRDSDMIVTGAVLVFHDVTEEYAAQQALRDQQFYTRSLFESNIDAIMTTDPAGIITDVNTQMEALTGRTRDELIGMPFIRCFTDPDRAEASIKLVLSNKKVTNYELTVRALDGKETVVSYNATIFYDRDHKVQGMFAAARDVTELKRIEMTLKENYDELAIAKTTAEKANYAKSDFLSSMSHELRSPLNAILGFAQLMDSDNPRPTPSQQTSISQILESGWYLLALINEILDLATIESGRMTLSMEPVSLTEIMLEIQTMMEPQGKTRNIEMSFSHSDPPLYVHADRTRLKQVIINILSNAIKYNRKGGSIVIDSTRITPDQIRISVRDTGEGLPPEKVALLFQSFNRLGQETSTEQGTGIGLVMSKRLVELMDGAIGVESTTGVGSVFWIDLFSDVEPTLAVENVNPADVIPVQCQEGAPIHSLLYIEDNPANLKLVEHLVARHADLHMLTAVEAITGIEIARTRQPDVILMDINLPGISGVEALKILQQHPETAHIPVVAVSANAMPHDIKRGLEAGFFRYVTKPINVKVFEETLITALAFAKEKVVSVSGESDIPQIIASEPVTDESPSGILTQESLVTLPGELIGRLQDATMSADHDELLLLTDEVDQYDRSKSQQIKHCIDAYDYQSLLDLIKQEAEVVE